MSHLPSLRSLVPTSIARLASFTLLVGAVAISRPAPSQTAVREVWGSANGVEFGASIEPTTDLNSDGFADYLVGHPGSLGGFGGVSILSGRYLRTGALPSSVGTWDYTTGLSPVYRETGAAVSSIGQIFGDARPEVVIGAPGSGLGYIACMSPGFTGPIRVITGVATGDRLGAALAETNDVNLDGYEDVLVGAPLRDGTGTDKGAAYLISGYYLATGNGANTLHIFDGLADGGQTGAAVAGGVDFNGDGRRDLVVASPRNHGFPSGADAGVVRVFSGANYAQLWLGIGVTGERYGSALCIVPDLNGDGVSDLAIGAPYSDVGAVNGGRVVVLSGAAIGSGSAVPIVEWIGTTANALSGSAIAAIGDVNDDGIGDVGVGAYNYEALFSSDDNGAVFLYSGATLERMAQWVGAAEHNIGRALSSCLDADLDGATDLLVSGYHHASAGANDGYVAALSLFPEIPTSYCTGKTNSAGCVPSIGSNGSPSLTSASAFNVTATNELNQKSGLLFYGFDNNTSAFQDGTLCVKSPTVRTIVQSSGGSASGTDCTGAYSFDFNAHIQGGTDANLVLGQEVFCQYWSRDPASASTTALSNALRFLVNP